MSITNWHHVPCMQAVVNIEYFNIIIDYKQRSWEIKLSPESCSDPAFNNVQYKKNLNSTFSFEIFTGTICRATANFNSQDCGRRARARDFCAILTAVQKIIYRKLTTFIGNVDFAFKSPFITYCVFFLSISPTTVLDRDAKYWVAFCINLISNCNNRAEIS